MQETRNIRKMKGITLIALVITIIVLLILAGISIATLAGENGILNKAEIAKEENQKAEAEEQIKLAVMASYDENGKVDLNKLKKELGKIPDIGSIRHTNNDDNFPIEVELNGNIFKIDENGNVTRIAVAPVVNYTLSTEEAVAEGTEVTVTITATTTEGTIAKISKQGEVIETNKETATFVVTTNGMYEVVVEGSNGEKTTCNILITNIGNTEIFSDIYGETKNYTDKNGNIARIPEGFAVGISSTINMIENGLVITDEIDENHKSVGNQFVWIPVNNEANFKRVAGFENKSRQTSDFSYCSEPYSGGTQEEKDLYSSMHNSVITNKGFYIGRYEAGKNTDGSVVSKKNMTPYSNIGWNNSTDSNTSLDGGAVELARDFVNGKSYENIVTSSLCYGIQWDATMQFFDNSYINGTPTTTSYVRYGYPNGWFYKNYQAGNLNHKTGIDVDENASNKVKNIYDMSGNLTEMTMEAYQYGSDVRVVCRGGAYNFDTSSINYGAAASPSYRYRGARRFGGGGASRGFRLTLHFSD